MIIEIKNIKRDNKIKMIIFTWFETIYLIYEYIFVCVLFLPINSKMFSYFRDENRRKSKRKIARIE